MTRLVRAELPKLRTTRTAYGLAALAAAGTAALVAGSAARRPAGQPALSADSLPMLVPAPAQPLTLAALLLGILGMAGEFRHQTVTQTFLVTPDRGRVVAAKLVASPWHGIAMALASSAAVLAVGLPWLRAKGITPPSPTPAWPPGWPGGRRGRAVRPGRGRARRRWSATRSRPWSSACCGGPRGSSGS